MTHRMKEIDTTKNILDRSKHIRRQQGIDRMQPDPHLARHPIGSRRISPNAAKSPWCAQPTSRPISDLERGELETAQSQALSALHGAGAGTPAAEIREIGADRRLSNKLHGADRPQPANGGTESGPPVGDFRADGADGRQTAKPPQIVSEQVSHAQIKALAPNYEAAADRAQNTYASPEAADRRGAQTPKQTAEAPQQASASATAPAAGHSGDLNRTPNDKARRPASQLRAAALPDGAPDRENAKDTSVRSDNDARRNIASGASGEPHCQTAREAQTQIADIQNRLTSVQSPSKADASPAPDIAQSQQSQGNRAAPARGRASVTRSPRRSQRGGKKAINGRKFACAQGATSASQCICAFPQYLNAQQRTAQETSKRYAAVLPQSDSAFAQTCKQDVMCGMRKAQSEKLPPKPSAQAQEIFQPPKQGFCAAYVQTGKNRYETALSKIKPDSENAAQLLNFSAESAPFENCKTSCKSAGDGKLEASRQLMQSMQNEIANAGSIPLSDWSWLQNIAPCENAEGEKNEAMPFVLPKNFEPLLTLDDEQIGLYDKTSQGLGAKALTENLRANIGAQTENNETMLSNARADYIAQNKALVCRAQEKEKAMHCRFEREMRSRNAEASEKFGEKTSCLEKTYHKQVDELFAKSQNKTAEIQQKIDEETEAARQKIGEETDKAEQACVDESLVAGEQTEDGSANENDNASQPKEKNVRYFYNEVITPIIKFIEKRLESLKTKIKGWLEQLAQYAMETDREWLIYVGAFANALCDTFFFIRTLMIEIAKSCHEVFIEIADADIEEHIATAKHIGKTFYRFCMLTPNMMASTLNAMNKQYATEAERQFDIYWPILEFSLTAAGMNDSEIGQFRNVAPDVFRNFDEFSKNFRGALSAFWDKFLSIEGIASVASNIMNDLLHLWLPKSNISFPTSLNISAIIKFALEICGLNVDSVLKHMGFKDIDEFHEKMSGTSISDLLEPDNIAKVLPSFATSVIASIAADFFKDFLEDFIKKAVEKMVVKLVTMATPVAGIVEFAIMLEQFFVAIRKYNAQFNAIFSSFTNILYQCAWGATDGLVGAFEEIFISGGVLLVQLTCKIFKKDPAKYLEDKVKRLRAKIKGALTKTRVKAQDNTEKRTKDGEANKNGAETADGGEANKVNAEIADTDDKKTNADAKDNAEKKSKSDDKDGAEKKSKSDDKDDAEKKSKSDDKDGADKKSKSDDKGDADKKSKSDDKDGADKKSKSNDKDGAEKKSKSDDKDGADKKSKSDDKDGADKKSQSASQNDASETKTADIIYRTEDLVNAGGISLDTLGANLIDQTLPLAGDSGKTAASAYAPASDSENRTIQHIQTENACAPAYNAQTRSSDPTLSALPQAYEITQGNSDSVRTVTSNAADNAIRATHPDMRIGQSPGEQIKIIYSDSSATDVLSYASDPKNMTQSVKEIKSQKLKNTKNSQISSSPALADIALAQQKNGSSAASGTFFVPTQPKQPETMDEVRLQRRQLKAISELGLNNGKSLKNRFVDAMSLKSDALYERTQKINKSRSSADIQKEAKRIAKRLKGHVKDGKEQLNFVSANSICRDERLSPLSIEERWKAEKDRKKDDKK